MSPQIAKFSGYALAAFSAALILHAGDATAGDTRSAEQSLSFQGAVQNVLTGNHRFHVAPGQPTAYVDTVQERIQQVLLGSSRFRVGITETRGRIGGLPKLTSIRAEHRPSPVNTQAAVQRMLQGDHAPVRTGFVSKAASHGRLRLPLLSLHPSESAQRMYDESPQRSPKNLRRCGPPRLSTAGYRYPARLASTLARAYR